MLLSVQPAQLSIPTAQFVFVVPGQQAWTPRSVIGTVSRDVGGAPARAYTLEITDGTTLVAAVGADDAGTEPGVCTVTWCDVPAATSSAGSVGTVVAPLPRLLLNPGYVITGTIVNGAPADTWLTAAVWFDFSYTG